MENIYKDFSADVITGKRPVSDFESYVKQWNEAGGDEITEYANETIK